MTSLPVLSGTGRRDNGKGPFFLSFEHMTDESEKDDMARLPVPSGTGRRDNGKGARDRRRHVQTTTDLAGSLPYLESVERS